MKTKLFLFLFLISCLLSLIVNPIYAQEVSLSITPPNIIIQTEAPAQIEKQLQITNNSDTTQTLSITLKPFVASTLQGKPLYKADLDIFQHVEIFDNDTKIEELTLLPKQQKNLKLQILLPENQPNQDYYFSIVFISKDINIIDSGVAKAPQNDTQQSVKAITNIQPGIAANVLLSVFTGKKQPEGIIQSYSAPLFGNRGPVSFTLTFANTGSYLLIPQGTVLITNMFGQTVGKIPVPLTYVLANSKRDIKLTWNENILFGPYKATLYLGYADNKQISFKRPLVFIGLPFAILGSIMITIIVVALLRSRLKKHIVKK